MTESIHPVASHHLPSFITAPDEIDVLVVVMGIILLLFVLRSVSCTFGCMPYPNALHIRRCSLRSPGVLALLAMFTLALIDFPDFSGLFRRIAGSTEKIASKNSREEADQSTDRLQTD